eukprot:c15854_g1_i1.p1 GENE.c15854_g1_i1~~c15854_g1_i1.p1  ORF type:complete len:369 (-),score=110.16 c15854_g1_i1:66-1133(-)
MKFVKLCLLLFFVVGCFSLDEKSELKSSTSSCDCSKCSQYQPQEQFDFFHILLITLLVISLSVSYYLWSRPQTIIKQDTVTIHPTKHKDLYDKEQVENEIKEKEKLVEERVIKEKVDEKVDEQKIEKYVEQAKPKPSSIEQTVIIMRHANRQDLVDPNWEKTAARPYDPDIVDEFQVKEAAKEIDMFGFGVKYIISSPFLRCIRTAAICAKELGISEIYVDNRVCEVLTERNMKKKSPVLLTKEEIESLIPDIKFIYNQDFPLPQYPETIERARSRYSSSFSSISKMFSGNILIVSHGDAVAQFISTSNPKLSVEDVYETPFCCYVKATAQITNNSCRWSDQLLGEGVGVLQDFA